MTTFFACGPRTGIHNDTNEVHTTQNRSQSFICGNALIEQKNIETAIRILGISGDYSRGAKLFKQNCVVCHDLMDRKFIGPGLQGFYSRIPDPKVQWLRTYILNSTKVYKSGNSYAKKLRRQYPKDTMPSFEEYLTERDIDDIMFYIVGNTN